MHVATKKTIYWCNKLVISLRFLWKKRHRDRRIWYQTVQYYVKLLFVKVELVQKKCKLWVLEDKEQPMIEQQREFYSRHGFSYKIWTTSVSFGCFIYHGISPHVRAFPLNGKAFVISGFIHVTTEDISNIFFIHLDSYIANRPQLLSDDPHTVDVR